MHYQTNDKKVVNYLDTIMSLVNDYVNGTYRVIPLKTIIYLLSFLSLYLKPKKKVTILTKIERISMLIMLVKSFKHDLDNYLNWKHKQNIINNSSNQQEIPIEVTV